MSTLSNRRADPQFGIVVTRAGVPSGLDLAALPEPGPLPHGLWLSVAVPLLAGAWIGYRAIGSASSSS